MLPKSLRCFNVLFLCFNILICCEYCFFKLKIIVIFTAIVLQPHTVLVDSINYCFFIRFFSLSSVTLFSVSLLNVRFSPFSRCTPCRRRSWSWYVSPYSVSLRPRTSVATLCKRCQHQRRRNNNQQEQHQQQQQPLLLQLLLLRPDQIREGRNY